jgi:hypothetical protein
MHGAKVVYASPHPKCNLPYSEIAQTVGRAFGVPTASVEPPLPRDYFALYITFACGLTQSTVYRKRVTFEIWVNYCGLTVCTAAKVFGFTHTPQAGRWECENEIIRQELKNDLQTDVLRVVKAQCK